MAGHYQPINLQPRISLDLKVEHHRCPSGRYCLYGHQRLNQLIGVGQHFTRVVANQLPHARLQWDPGQTRVSSCRRTANNNSLLF